MPSLLFWNVNGKKLLDRISSLCSTHEPDVLILAESDVSDQELLDFLNCGREQKYFPDLNISTRLKFYSKYHLERFKPLVDEAYFSIRSITPYLEPEVLVVAVHLPSKLHASPMDQMMAAQGLAAAIRATELERKTNKTIVIGDFNMSPFEDGMVAANGLHAVLDQKYALKLGRKLKNVFYPFFYNPMWGRQGDLTVGPSGTYRYSKATEVNHYWHTFDQVLLRPSLLDGFKSERLRVIAEKGSDHFPIFLGIDMEAVL
jgi:exonuclease III